MRRELHEPRRDAIQRQDLVDAVDVYVEDIAFSLDDLVLRRALIDGRTSIQGLSSSLALSISVTEALVIAMRDKKLIEFGGMVGRDYVISLTEAGRNLATERMQACTYAGTSPVPLTPASSRIPGPEGGRCTEILPGDGRKPVSGSSA